MKRKKELCLRGLKFLRAIYETTPKQYADGDKLFQRIRENDIKDVNKYIKELEVQDEKRKPTGI